MRIGHFLFKLEHLMLLFVLWWGLSLVRDSVLPLASNIRPSAPVLASPEQKSPAPQAKDLGAAPGEFEIVPLDPYTNQPLSLDQPSSEYQLRSVRDRCTPLTLGELLHGCGEGRR